MSDPERSLVHLPPRAVAAASSLAKRTIAERLERAVAVAIRTMLVDPSDPACYGSIGAAVEAARPGDRVLVRPGHYHESVVLDKAISVEGDGEREAIVVVSEDFPCFIVTNDGARVAYLTMTGHPFKGSCWDWHGHDGESSGVWVRGASPTIESNEVYGTDGFGIEVSGSGSLPVIRDNNVHDTFCGVFVHRGASPTIKDNEVHATCWGIMVDGVGSEPFIRGNRVHGGRNSGIAVSSGASPTIESNEVCGNPEFGIQVEDSGSNPIIRGNVVRDTGVLIARGASPTIESDEDHLRAIFVDGGAPPAIKPIEDYLSAIFVARGASPTIESNDIHGNKGHGIRVQDSGSNPIIRGNVVRDSRRNGINVSGHASPTIEENEVHGNVEGDIDISEAGPGAVVRGNRIGR